MNSTPKFERLLKALVFGGAALVPSAITSQPGCNLEEIRQIRGSGSSMSQPFNSEAAQNVVLPEHKAWGGL